MLTRLLHEHLRVKQISYIHAPSILNILMNPMGRPLTAATTALLRAIYYAPDNIYRMGSPDLA